MKDNLPEEVKDTFVEDPSLKQKREDEFNLLQQKHLQIQARLNEEFEKMERD